MKITLSAVAHRLVDGQARRAHPHWRAVAAVYFDVVCLVDGKRSNVGSETWQMMRTNDGWKISAMADSSYPDRAR